VAIERSAAPARVKAGVDQLIERRPSLAARLVDEPELTERVVAVIAASRSLTRLLTAAPSVRADSRADAPAEGSGEVPVDPFDVLADLDRRRSVDDATPERLVRWKQLEYLRIAARDLTGLDELPEVGAALAALAADVVAAACTLSGAEGLAVVGMGKLGGAELNYSSDIDLMFVGDGSPEALEASARSVMSVAGQSFRVDLNLRPEGRDGRLVRTIESYEAYWDRWAEPWEFQALLKARPIAGDRVLGQRFEATAARWLWNHPFQTEDLRSLRAMKARAEELVARQGMSDRELKLGPGGIRDIEFTVQLLQLVHGHADVGLRSPTTLVALAEMGDAGYIDPDDATRLADAYRMLRTVEHRLQMVDEQQVHALPTDADSLDHLARVLGYRDATAGTAAEQLDGELRRRRLGVRSIQQRVYFRPLLEAFATGEGALSPEAAVARMKAFGFTDAKRTQAAVRELTRGLNRSSRLMQQMLPLMLDWLSASPDPDLGLLQLRNLLTGPQRQTTLIEAFRESPESAQRLSVLLGTSRLLGTTLARNPDLVVRLPHPERLATRPRDELVTSADQAVSWRPDRADKQEALQRWNDRNRLGVAARDLLGAADVHVVGRDLSTLAEATVQATLDTIEPQVPFAVLALGRLGGAELSYASDLDVIFVFDGGASAFEEADRVATALMRFIGGSTPAGRIYEIDASLRPEGRQGPMARSLEAYRSYWDRYALVWERQAMLRARPIAGDLALGRRLLDDLAPRIWSGLTAEDAREIRRMKARIERERMPAGEDPAFHLKLGRGSLSDIEFTAQLLQLQHGVAATGTGQAIGRLVAADALESDDAELLLEAYRFCEQTRNRWYLVNSAPGDALPNRPEELLWLARSLDLTPAGLRERYRRVTRRARTVVERVFYGQP